MGSATVGHECPVCKATYETVGQLWEHRGDYFGLAPDECGGRCAPPKRKYGNEPTEYNGVVYHSALEAACAAELDRLRDDPAVRGPFVVMRQARFELYPDILYVADFLLTFWEEPAKVVVEAKGVRTAAWKLKERLFRAELPGVPLLVVRTPAEIEPLLRELGGG
jgi:hypothetical protein